MTTQHDDNGIAPVGQSDTDPSATVAGGEPAGDAPADEDTVIGRSVWVLASDIAVLFNRDPEREIDGIETLLSKDPADWQDMIELTITRHQAATPRSESN